MTSAVAIRVATEVDLDALTSLRQAFWASQSAQGLLDIPREAALSAEATAKLVRRPRAVVMVAVDDGMLGYAVGALQIAPHLTVAKVAIVEEVYVNPAVGQGGIGSTLVETTFDHLLGPDGGRRQARVLPGNEAAVKFWAKRGFIPTLLTVERE